VREGRILSLTMRSTFATANREAQMGAQRGASLTTAAGPELLVGGLVFVVAILPVLLIPVRSGVPV
jgi:hypothetical protein